MLPRFTCATSDPPAVAGVKSVTASDGTTSDVQVTDVSKSYVYIKPVNQAPQFDAPFVTTDGKAQLWINSASQAVPINGTKVYELPASDVDGDALTFTLTAAPKHGTVTILNSQSFSYKADQGFSGIDQFDITVDDHLGTPGHPHTTDALSTVSTVFIQARARLPRALAGAMSAAADHPAPDPP